MRLASYVATVILLVVGSAPAHAQTTTGSVTGTVQDAQGGVVPGATVTLTNNRRGDELSTTSEPNGVFIFPQVQPAEYTLKVALAGFKTVVKTNLVLNANDKLSAGIITLEIGGLNETVSVAGRVTELQTASAERGYALEGGILQNVAVNSRSYLALVQIAPGVVHTNPGALQTAGHAGLSGITANGARTNQNNLTLDGIGNVDTGNNGDQLATLSLDAVEEFKVLTANYQAEYGRSSGAQISVVTKSGGHDFHGSGYWYGRNDRWNANSWLNNRDGQPKQRINLNDLGYTIGGPLIIPGTFNTGRNRLFFFWSQEYQKQLRPQNERRRTMPTELERNGNFSQSVDRSGNPFPYIRDYTTGLPCGATDTRGCFQHQGMIGWIPPNRLYQPGLAILRMLPLPNAPGNVGFNYRTQISDDYPRREDMLRLDWTPRDDWRVFGRFVNNYDQVTSAYGSFVLGSNFPLVPIVDRRPGRALAISATRTLSSSMFNEATVGFGHNAIDIFAVNEGLTRAATGLSGLPMLYPGAITNDYLPRFQWGGRITNDPQFGTNNAPFYNYNTTIDVVDNFTKVFPRHAVKMGFYYQKSQKDQSSFANSNGQINFGDSSSNPLDTGFGFANTALGIYSTFNQASQYVIGQYRYDNIEWYVQDNWRPASRLTLDYGMRFYWIQPQYDAAFLTSTFLPDRFDPRRAPRLFRPALVGGQRVALDPVTGRVEPALNIGRIVPGSGDLLNGIARAGTDVSKYLMKNRGVHYAPRFGLTYDLSGVESLIVRGGAGVFYDRYQGNETFDMITNPPTTFAPTLENGLLAEVDPGRVLLAPSSLHAFLFDGFVPTVYNYNAGVQIKLPRATTLDVSYVGSQSRHLLQRRNINPVQYGAAFLAENQDPTRTSSVPGGASLPADFLRPYPGWGDIRLHEMTSEANFNSVQASLNRRFQDGLLVGINYTLGRAFGITDGGDGNFIRIDGRDREVNYGPLNHDRRHNFVANFVYELPALSGRLGPSTLAHYLVDDWQISGLYIFQSGAPYTPGFSIPGVGNQNLSGSFTEGARIAIIRDPGSGHGDDPYRQFETAAFTSPSVGSLGLESGRNYLNRAPVNNLDLSVQKSFGLGRAGRLQLRLDAFNALNHTQFNDVNSTLNLAGLTDPTPTNLPFDEKGNLIAARRSSGFGTISTVRNPRILQLVARVQF